MNKPFFFIVLFLFICTGFAEYSYSEVFVCSGECGSVGIIPPSPGGSSYIPPENVTEEPEIVPATLEDWVDLQIVGFLTNIETAIFVSSENFQEFSIQVFQKLAQFDAWMGEKTSGITNAWFIILLLLAISYTCRRKIAVPVILIFFALYILIRHFDHLF